MATRVVADCGATAFVEGRPKKCGTHDRVDVYPNGKVSYQLFGNVIATREGKAMVLSAAGHVTQTTKDRLNTILRRCDKTYQFYIKDKKFRLNQDVGVFKEGDAWSGVDWKVQCNPAQTPEAPTPEAKAKTTTAQGAPFTSEERDFVANAASAFREGNSYVGGKEEVEARGRLISLSHDGRNIAQRYEEERSVTIQRWGEPGVADRLNVLIAQCGLPNRVVPKAGGRGAPPDWVPWAKHGTVKGYADFDCPTARVSKVGAKVPPPRLATTDQIAEAAKAFVQGKPYKAGDERVEVWLDRDTRRGVISYQVRDQSQPSGHQKLFDRWSNSSQVDPFKPEVEQFERRWNAVRAECDLTTEENMPTPDSFKCNNARKFTMTKTSEKPSPFTREGEEKAEPTPTMSPFSKVADAFVKGEDLREGAWEVKDFSSQPGIDGNVVRLKTHTDNPKDFWSIGRDGKTLKFWGNPPPSDRDDLREMMKAVIVSCGTTGHHVERGNGVRAKVDGELLPEGDWKTDLSCPRAKDTATSALTGPAKFGLPSGAEVDEGKGKTCKVCGKSWGAHAHWDCPPSNTGTRTNSGAKTTSPDQTEVSTEAPREMPRDCVVRAVQEGTVQTLFKEPEEFRGRYHHAQTPSEVAVVKSYFRDQPAVRPFTGFLVKVNLVKTPAGGQVYSKDYQHVKAYSGRPTRDQKLYKVVMECGPPSAKQALLGKFGVE